MFRKNYYLIVLTIAFVFISSFAAFGQATQELKGQVELKKEDGTMVPVAGALIEVFRVDKKESYAGVKTDESGKFTVTGIPSGGIYVAAVSGEKIKAAILDVSDSATQSINFVVSSGDGAKFSESQIREAIAKSGELTPEQLAEREKIIARNKKAEQANEIITRTIGEGKKAYDAKNFDLAIAKFEEGFQASPDYIGSAPQMLNNKGASYVARGLIAFNKMVQSKDPAEKNELKPHVQDDFNAAIDAYSESWKISKAAKAEEIAKIQKNFDIVKEQTLLGAQDCVRLIVRTDSASEAKKDAVTELMREYISWEKDQTKKGNAQLNLGIFMNKIYDFEGAVTEFRKAFEFAPNNPDVVGQLGLALYTVTYEQNDMARKQEALNYLQLYVDTAPKDHPLRAGDGMESAIADLKKQKLTPKKIAAKN